MEEQIYFIHIIVKIVHIYCDAYDFKTRNFVYSINNIQKKNDIRK